MTEEQLFEIKQKFLQLIPHPKLIQKQIDRLREFKAEEFDIEDYNLNEQAELLDFFKQYITVLLNLKLKIAHSNEGGQLRQYLQVLRDIQVCLIKKLIVYIPENCEVDDSSIKQSDPFDAHAYAKELQLENVQENEIKDYLCMQFNKETSVHSELAKGVLRARKIGVE